MAITKIPSSGNLQDKQVVEIEGPDGITTIYQYDLETKSLYGKESQVVIPSFHGITHIAQDPVPCATSDNPGLMCADDKAKLDALTQTKLGVLGFTGAGFPDDNGFITGEVLFAAGTEFISIERVGNTIRFTVDSPLPLNCNVEECANIFWVQDETDIASIRPPSCAGKLPGVNAYGELKIYLMPETTLVNTSNPSSTLNTKGSYPSLIFKRYDDSITPGKGEIDIVLDRNSNGTTKTGWAMTPGALGVSECVWYTGLDSDSNQITFELHPESEPELLGQLLYKGHSITKQMGVIIGYTSTITSTNQYNVKYWSIADNKAVGDSFVATNVWRYDNPESTSTDPSTPQALILDTTVDILSVGTLVSLWEFKIGESGNERILRRFFSKEPNINASSLWSVGNAIKFGDNLTAREEINPSAGGGSDQTAHTTVDDIRLIERSLWGITGFDDPLYLSDDGEVTADSAAGQVIRSDTAASINTGSLLVPPSNDNDPIATHNFIVVGQAALIGGPFAWIINEFAGRTFRWTSGNLSGTEYTILENTESTITVLGEAFNAQVGNRFDVFIESTTNEPSGTSINNQYIADIDNSIPGLRVYETLPESDRERPVFIWDRNNYENIYVSMLLGQPLSSRFPPIDILMRAPVDRLEERYVKIIRRGQLSTGPFAGSYFAVVKGTFWREIPKSGTLRVLTGLFRNQLWSYDYKTIFDRYDDDAIMLINTDEPFPFDEDHVPTVEGTGSESVTAGLTGTEAERALITVPGNTTVAEVLHEEYTTPAIRLEFSIDETPGQEAVQLQFRTGILSMAEKYEFDISTDPADDLVRGFIPGEFSVSKIYTQNGFITTGTETVTSDPSDFRVYKGGSLAAPISGQTELFNRLEIMYRDSQLWIWWNGLLIPPDNTASSVLPTPVSVNTPYFEVESASTVGKFGLRLWPGAIVREITTRTQLKSFTEFSYAGQLEIVT